MNCKCQFNLYGFLKWMNEINRKRLNFVLWERGKSLGSSYTIAPLLYFKYLAMDVDTPFTSFWSLCSLTVPFLSSGLQFPLRSSYKAFLSDRVPEGKSDALSSSWSNSTEIHWVMIVLECFSRWLFSSPSTSNATSLVLLLLRTH